LIVEKENIAVDFDGVIHSYTSHWIDDDIIPDPPIPGAIEWMKEISKHYNIIIFTMRGRSMKGRAAVLDWLYTHGYTSTLVVTDVKPLAVLYIDDRGYRFTGRNFPTADAIRLMHPRN
jgi:hypothetical protein